MNKNLKKQIKNTLKPPEPDRKETFLNRFSYFNLNKKSFWLIQIKFIRKRFWIISFLFLILSILILWNGDIKVNSLMTVSFILPILSVLGIGEIQRSFFYKMYELEMTCKYSMQDIFVIRSTIVFTIYIIICFILSLFTIKILEFELMKTLFILLTPFLLFNYIYLSLLNKINCKELINIMLIICVIIFIININFGIKMYLLYETYKILCKLIVILLITKIILKTKKLSKEMRYLNATYN